MYEYFKAKSLCFHTSLYWHREYLNICLELPLNLERYRQCQKYHCWFRLLSLVSWSRTLFITLGALIVVCVKPFATNHSSIVPLQPSATNLYPFVLSAKEIQIFTRKEKWDICWAISCAEISKAKYKTAFLSIPK